MQGLSSMDYTPEVLQLLYSVPAKSRQGRLAEQDDMMEKEVWEASKSNGISNSTRARAGRNVKKGVNR